MGEMGKINAGSLSWWVLGSGHKTKDGVNGRGISWALESRNRAENRRGSFLGLWDDCEIAPTGGF